MLSLSSLAEMSRVYSIKMNVVHANSFAQICDSDHNDGPPHVSDPEQPYRARKNRQENHSYGGSTKFLKEWISIVDEPHFRGKFMLAVGACQFRKTRMDDLQAT